MMASARVFFSRKRNHRNGFINDEVPVVENGYDVPESDEDEVFVQDPNLEISASKPLMHPRNKGQRTKVKTRTIECRFCTVCKPIFYFIVLVTVLCGVMATIVYIANRHSNQSNSGVLLQGAESSSNGVREKTVVIGCDKIEVEDVWVVGVPKLLTESAFRLVDVNKDGVLDVIFGFATGADGYGVKDIVCDLYFEGHKPCFGGVMAMEGATGKELWRRYTGHEIYGLNCQYDLDKDGVKDCLAAGRAGTFVAISSKDGALLWEFGDNEARNPVMNFYTPQYISDVDGDEIADVIVIHGGDPLQEAGSEHRLSGRILLVSGKTGQVLQWNGVPDNRESYYSPQITTRIDGVQVLLFGTGGETHNGSLWRLEVESLKTKQIGRAVKLSSDTHKGFMTPPSLADVTGDGVEDIIIPMFNSTLLALNGNDYMPIWSVRFPMSETYSTPAVGYFNDDDVPDFMVKYAHGPGFPVYYYSETTVIDGKTGKKLIDPPLRDTIGAQSSPITVSMEGSGNDVFLVWMADCKGHEGSTEEFSFVKGTSDHEKSRSNLCRLRFKSEGYSKMIAVSRMHSKDGITIYNSEERKTVEHSKWVNTTAEAYEYILKHPEMFAGYGDETSSSQWDSLDYRRPAEELYNEPQYQGSHRTSSKKGPSGGSSRNRNNQYPSSQGSYRGYNNQLGTQTSHYSPKGSNSGTYNTASGFNSGYLPQNQQILPEDAYSSPYNSNGGNGYYENPFESYYPNDDRNFNTGGDYYRQGYPYKYKNAHKRTANAKYVKDLKGFMANKRRRRRKREIFRRHVGPHDDEGLQRLLSTGTLAPTTLPTTHADYNNSIDVIFATYWFFPAKTQAILPQDQKCIADKLAEEGVVRYDADSPYYQMNHDEYEEAITAECLKSSDHHLPTEGTYANSDDEYNPFDLNMGQMTVYRLRLKLTCSQPINSTDTNTKCASVLPFDQQRWAAYMGSNGDSHWTPPVM